MYQVTLRLECAANLSFKADELVFDLCHFQISGQSLIFVSNTD